MLARDILLFLGNDRYVNDVYMSHHSSLSHRYKVTPGPIVHGNMRDPNSWNYSIDDLKSVNAVTTDTYGGTVVKRVGYFGGNSPPPSGPTWDRTMVYNMCLEKLNAKVRGTLDLSVSLAEAGSTIRMVKSLADLVHYAESYMRRPKPKDAANWYLQWKYGWSPLCSDIFGAANESLRIVINQFERVSSRVTLPLPSSQQSVWSGVDGIANVPMLRRTIGKQSCTIVLDLAIPQSSFQIDRWMSLNPVSIGWEIIPYSFVVDWVFDVGSYIRNFETACLYNSTFRSGYVSELYIADGVEEQYPPRSTYRVGSRTITKGKAEFRQKKFFRTKLGGYPFPRPPTFRVDLGGSQLLSTAALLTQIFTKGK